MNEIEHDLDRWESGSLSLDELAELYPDEDLGGMLSVIDRLVIVAQEPVSYDETTWEHLRDRLTDATVTESPSEPRRRQPLRTLLLAAAMVIATAAMAMAAVPPVLGGFSMVVREVSQFLGPDTSEPVEIPASDPHPGTGGRPHGIGPRDGNQAVPEANEHAPGPHGASGGDGEQPSNGVDEPGDSGTSSGGHHGDQGAAGDDGDGQDQDGHEPTGSGGDESDDPDDSDDAPVIDEDGGDPDGDDGPDEDVLLEDDLLDDQS